MESKAPSTRKVEATEKIFHSLQVDHLCALDFDETRRHPRLTGIVCTIGPASRDVAVLVSMMRAGMTIARLNFSHGSYDYHGGTIVNIREAVRVYSEGLGFEYPLAIALDTKGPEIRTGLLAGGGSAEVELKKGGRVKLTTDKGLAESGTVECVYVDYANIVRVVSRGNRVFIDDGLISLLVDKIGDDFLECSVENGGMLGSRKGVNLPGVPVDLPAISEKDKADIQFGIEQQVDMIFASFIRDGAGARAVCDLVRDAGILVISKVENHQGMVNIDDVIAQCHGLMVARGDMGIEIPPARVFIAQKTMIARCNVVGKPIICATQMLESMVHKPRPTRAEVSDVANAILDGADSVMLSGETAKGDYPVECITTMADIAREAEAVMWQSNYFTDLLSRTEIPASLEHALAISVVQASTFSAASAIVVTCFSDDQVPILISKYRPRCPIIVVIRCPFYARKLFLHRGVTALTYYQPPTPNFQEDVEGRLHYGVFYGQCRGYIRGGDPVVVVSGSRSGGGASNTMRLYRAPVCGQIKLSG